MGPNKSTGLIINEIRIANQIIDKLVNNKEETMKKPNYQKTVSEFSFILKPSAIPNAGIGIFTTHAIAKGTILSSPWRMIGELRNSQHLHADFTKFCLYINQTVCICPSNFQTIDIWWFGNHSASNNTIFRKEDRVFIAVRDINEGEEITYDYNVWEEPSEIKEHYYHNMK